MAAGIVELSVSLVGPGRAARAFARSWMRAGGTIADVIGRDPDRTALAVAQIGGGNPRRLGSGRVECGVLIVGVPDDVLRDVAGSLGKRVSCRAAFHLSGALGAHTLAALADDGIPVGSLHPLRAFAGLPEEDWRNAFVTVEGDAPAVATGARIVQAVGGNAHEIAASAKPLYHAAATLAAAGSLALVSMAARAWAAAGISEEQGRAALADLAAGAARAGAHPFADAFTGPVARRDVGTVRAHAAALAAHPETLAVYAALARETLARTAGRGKELEILAVLDDLRPG